MIELTNKQKYGFFQVGFFVLPDFFRQNEIDEMKVSFQSFQETAFSSADQHLDELEQEKETCVMHQGSQFFWVRFREASTLVNLLFVGSLSVVQLNRCCQNMGKTSTYYMLLASY